MKIAILADIHANHLALEAVLHTAKKLSVDKLLIAGDLIGYYFEPLKVLKLLEKWPKIITKGNHEEYLEHSLENEQKLFEYEFRYGSGIRIAIEQLDDSQLDTLVNFDHPKEVELEDSKILLCHGSPWDIDYYVYPDASKDIVLDCAVKSFNLVILGHTHFPMIFELDGVTILNPGSVGQPRNRVPGAHWALFDTKSKKIELRIDKYDPMPIVSECQIRHPEIPYLSEVLLRK